MLRLLLLGFSLLVFCAGLLLLAVSPSNALPLLVFGALLTLSALFERWRYKQPKTPGSAPGVATGERFVDPESGALMEVWYDAATGERSYVRVDK